MPTQVNGQVFPQGPLVVGQGDTPFSQGKQGELLVSHMNPLYYSETYIGKSFSAYAAAVATTVVGTAMVGLQIWNGSGVAAPAVNLVLLKAAGFIVVTSATTTGLVIATGTGQTSAPTSTTAITRSGTNLVGSTFSPSATAFNAGTFVNAPTALFPVLHNTAAIGTTGEDAGYSIDLNGSIVIAPGAYVAMAALGATAAASSCFHYLSWMEIPV